MQVILLHILLFHSRQLLFQRLLVENDALVTTGTKELLKVIVFQDVSLGEREFVNLLHPALELALDWSNHILVA